MKIALLSHLASETAPTGAERSQAVLAAGLVERGHEVEMAVPGPWALEDEVVTAGASVTRLTVRSCWLVQYGPQPVWLQAVRALRYAMPDSGKGRLRSWLSAAQPDVVHVNCLPHLRGAAAARSLGLPVVWHLREILPPGMRRRWFAGHLRRHATRIVAVSEAVAGWLREEGLGDLVEVVYNGVEAPADEMDQASARVRFDLPQNAVIVGLFSQLVPHKGAIDFVQAAHGAAAENPELHFVIAGHGPAAFADRVAGAATDGAAGDRIYVIPPQPEIRELLAAVDVVTLPTLWPDPLPRAVMEAMAAGRAVVAYADGGVPEMVVDGETGVLCRPGDIDGLTQAVVDLTADVALRQRFGEAGRRRARELFNVDRHVEGVESVLQAAASVHL
jgi:glycosyltransferase involved in cell wall biosynthesis